MTFDTIIVGGNFAGLTVMDHKHAPFANPAAVASYTADTPRKVPGLADLHRMVMLLLAEDAPGDAHILVVGAGGGMESEISDTGIDLSNPAAVVGDDAGDGDAGTGDSETPKEAKGRRAQSKKIRRAPEGAQVSLSSKALERIPDVKILLDPEQIADKLLKGRAGKFYKDGQELFINGLYPVVERMAAELESEFVGTADPEEIREAALRASRKCMAFRVGKVVCFALSKRLAEDWSVDDLDTATSPESLSMAADDYRQSLTVGKKWVKELLKVNQVEGVVAA